VKIKDVIVEAGRGMADKLMKPQSYKDIVDTAKLRKYGMTKPLEKQYQNTLINRLQAHLANPNGVPMDDDEVVQAFNLMKQQEKDLAKTAKQQFDISALADKIRRNHPEIPPQEVNAATPPTAQPQSQQWTTAKRYKNKQTLPVQQAQLTQPVQQTQPTQQVQPTAQPQAKPIAVQVPGVGAVTKNPEDGQWYEPNGDVIVIPQDIAELERRAEANRKQQNLASKYVPDSEVVGTEPLTRAQRRQLGQDLG
jgi:hypothetical protein